MTNINVVFIDHLKLLMDAMPKFAKIPNVRVTSYGAAPIDEQQIVERAKSADVIVVDVVTRYSAEVLQQLPRLRAIITTSVDTHHIDVGYCRRNAIEVVNFPGFNAPGAAEAAFAYALAILRDIPIARQHVVNFGFNLSNQAISHLMGWELAGKTLGVVGAGNVGAEIIRIGTALNMNVIATTKRPSAARARRLGLTKFTTLTDLLKQSEVVMLAVGHQNDGNALLKAPELRRINPEAILVNVGSWDVVDLHALAEAIYKRRLAGVAIDCSAPGPPPELLQHILIQEMIRSPNVLLLPDLSSSTQESSDRLIQQMHQVLTRLPKTFR